MVLFSYIENNKKKIKIYAMDWRYRLYILICKHPYNILHIILNLQKCWKNLTCINANYIGC